WRFIHGASPPPPFVAPGLGQDVVKGLPQRGPPPRGRAGCTKQEGFSARFAPRLQRFSQNHPCNFIAIRQAEADFTNEKGRLDCRPFLLSVSPQLTNVRIGFPATNDSSHRL